ncbi:MAG: hydroxyectoine utilization dehydratase EutB [Gammaproteobacteria bacterium]|nr:hydroxyectoine utilization dehydratase EutB [Gammaproteobacteria bacterium]
MNQAQHGHNSISVSDIEEAKQRISNQVAKTPLLQSLALSELCKSPAGEQTQVYLKLECLQTTGSFKLRGATNAMMSLSDKEKQKGVVCVSTGNHGRGLAYAAKQNDIPAIICMGSLVPQNKIDGIRALGAEVRIVGNSQDEAQIEVDRLVEEEGMTMLPPFDHPDIIAGQGTIALEVMEQIDHVHTIITPLSGGGLLAGVACAIKAKSPSTRVIGVTMEQGCAMHQSLNAGHPVSVEEFPTLADSLGGGIGLDNQFTFNMIQQLVDETVLVTEEEIADAIRHAYFKEQLIIEGSGSVAIAALLANKINPSGNTVALISGKNIDMNMHQKIINGETPDIY